MKDTSRWIGELGYNFHGAPQKPNKTRMADEANAKRLRNVFGHLFSFKLTKPSFAASKEKERYVKMVGGT